MSSPSPSRIPAWLTSISLTVIAACLVVLVVKSFHPRNPPPTAATVTAEPAIPIPSESSQVAATFDKTNHPAAAQPTRVNRPAPQVTINEISAANPATTPEITVQQNFYGGAALKTNLPTTINSRPAKGALLQYHARPVGSKMKIEGTSTIHDWSMESPVLGGSLEAEAEFPEDITGPVAAKLFIPVRTFKSYQKRMDDVMQEHMKEPQFKKISYQLLDLRPSTTAIATTAPSFDAIGIITVAGQSRTNTMPVTIARVAGYQLQVTGATSVKMTDFGVEPVNIMAGTIKTGDDVKLSFEWSLSSSQDQAQR